MLLSSAQAVTLRIAGIGTLQSQADVGTLLAESVNI
jgi:hypothetical protein